MKTLCSIHNNFPQFYKECCIIELEMDIPTQKRWTKMRKEMIPPEADFLSLKNLRESIVTNGLPHPITVWPQEKKLNVFRGIEQVWVAKTEGYTHISAYYIMNIEDLHIVHPPETNWYTKNKHLGEKACEEHREKVYKWLDKRGKSRFQENLNNIYEEVSIIIEKENI